MAGFINAVAYNDLPSVNSFVDNRVNINERHGRALYHAAWNNSLEIVKFLVKKGVDINRDERYSNPLYGAAAGGNLEIVKFLVENGADIDRVGPHGSALYAAADKGNLEIVKFLIENGASIDKVGRYSNALSGAVAGGNLEIVKFLIENGADINGNGRYYSNALSEAAAGGNLEIVKFFIENGASIDGDGRNGSALHAAVAARQQSLEMVKFLISKGADINLRDTYQRTALHRAVNQSSLSTVNFLLERKARPDAKDDSGITPFDLAAQAQNKAIVQSLLSKMNPPPSLSAKDWRSALRVESMTGLRFTFGKSLSVDVLDASCFDSSSFDSSYFDSSRSLDFASWHIDNLTSKPTAPTNYESTSAEPPNQTHDVLDGCMFKYYSHFTFHSRWWREYSQGRGVHPFSRRILDEVGMSEWVLEPSPLPSLGLCGRLEHGECFIESWFVVSCPTITNGEWPEPQVLIAGNYDDIEQLKGFLWITDLQSPLNNTHDGAAGDSWRLIRSFSTVDDFPVGRVQNIGDLVIPLIDKLGRTFAENNAQASHQLSRSRLDVLRNGGGNPRLLQRLLSDATMIEYMAENHAKIVQSLKNLLGSCESLQKGPWRLVGTPLQDSRRRVEYLATHGKGLRALLEKSQSIIQLEFNLASILEAQRSTTTNRSLKRLTWVTFAYLPLLFVASLFGMNVNILSNNPSFWWYFPIAGGFTLLTLVVWIIFKRFYTLEGNLEKYFAWLVGKD